MPQTLLSAAIDNQSSSTVSDAQLQALQTAAETGSVTAMVKLAGIYLNGATGARAPEKAEILYRKAAALGDADAIFHLGNMYLLGDGIPIDEQQALKLFEKAAAQGHPLALKNFESLRQLLAPQPNTSPIIDSDDQVTADERRAIEIARRYGINVDLRNVAGFENGFDDNVETAIPDPQGTRKLDAPMAQVAADAGNRDFEMAERYFFGNGVKQDEATAITYYRRAARASHPTAIERLLEIYRAAGITAPRCRLPGTDDEICF